MKKFYVSSLLVSLWITVVHAQNNPPSETRFTKDIGFNTTFILQGIFAAANTPFSVMYKKYSDEHKALRLGINASVNMTTNNPIPATSQYNLVDHSQASVSILVGKEFQHAINSRWIWYYGGDLSPGYQYNERKDYYGQTIRQRQKTVSYSLSARPFLGARYAIHPRIYVSAEASIGLGFRRSEESFWNQTGDLTIEGKYTTDRLNFSVSPASGIFLFYRF